MSSHAAIVVPSSSLEADIAQLENIGFVLVTIFPADEPRVARLDGHGLSLRLEVGSDAGVPSIRVPGLATDVVTSMGAKVVADSADFVMPYRDDRYVFTSGGDWGQGRAGMQYRDLIPDRHGGRVIASHIRIVEPGPVPDYVHHHDVRFQMIYCRRGRVQVIYEDQGDAFWMEAGDCVLQPPHIRHRVLASSDGCEVVEIASPAEHPTFVEHGITLPTAVVNPERDFGGQRFSFDRGAELPWVAVGDSWEAQVHGIESATDGLASVRILRPSGGDPAGVLPAALAASGRSTGDLCLLFVLQGTATVVTANAAQEVKVDDAITVASGDEWTIDAASTDFRCLHVGLGSVDG